MAHLSLRGLAVSVIAAAVVLAACSETTPDPAVLCFTQANGDGTTLITCDNGIDTIVSDGRLGRSGVGCTLADNGDGTQSIVCADGSRFEVDDGRDFPSCTAEETGDSEVEVVCGDTSGTVGTGDDGSSCSVTTDASAGEVVITCTDGTTARVNVGEDGQGCAVTRDEASDVTTVSCSDGASTVVDGVDGTDCTVSELPNADVVISCDGGETEVVIEGAARIGQVSGRARLFGRAQHSGIDVTVVETGEITQTGSDGRYTFDDLLVGSYTLRFDQVPYVSQEVQIPVVPGTLEVADVTLRIGYRFWPGTDAHVLDTCGDSAIVMLTDTVPLTDLLFDPRFDGTPSLSGLRGDLQVYDLDTDTFFMVQPDGPQFQTDCSADGTAMLMSSAVDDDGFPQGPALLWTRAAGVREMPFSYDQVELSLFTPGAGVLLVDLTANELALVNVATGVATVVPATDFNLGTASESLAYYQPVSGDWHLYGPADVSFQLPGTELARPPIPVGDTNLWVFDHDPDESTRSVSIADAAGGGFSTLTSTSNAQRPIASPDGRWVAYVNGFGSEPAGLPIVGQLVIWDVVNDEQLTSFPLVDVQSFVGRFSPNGNAFLYTTDIEGQPVETWLYDFVGGEHLGGGALGVDGDGVLFSGDSAWVAVHMSVDDGPDVYHVVDTATGAADPLEPTGDLLVWSPSSNALRYRSTTSNSYFLYRPTLGESQPVTLAGSGGDAVFSPSGDYLAVTGGFGIWVWDVAAGSSVVVAGEMSLGMRWAGSDNLSFLTNISILGPGLGVADLRVHVPSLNQTLPVENRVLPFIIGGSDVYVRARQYYPDNIEDGWYALRLR